MQIKRINDHDLPIPARATEGAAAFDLQAVDGGKLWPGDRALVSTGFAWDLSWGRKPDGTVASKLAGLVIPRSGLAWKHGITVLNAPGLIDSDYRGEIKVMLVNLGSVPWEWSAGDRIAQLMLAHPFRPLSDLEEVEDLTDTARGAGGFGSTGVSG